MKQKRFYLTKIVLNLILFLSAFFPHIALSAEIPITYQYNASQHQLTLNWPKHVRTSHALQGNDLVLTFNQPILIKRPDLLQQQSNGTIENVRFGYDKLLFTLASGVTPIVTPITGGMTIDLATQLSKQDSIGTSLLKIRLLAQRGNETEALKQLDDLEQKHPNNKDILLTRADILQQTGQWKSALTTYEKVSKSEPYNEDLQAVQKAIILDHSPYADVNVELRDTGKNRTEFFTRAEGEARVTNNVNLGVKLERNDAEVDAVINPSTNTPIRVDDDFYRGEAYLSVDSSNGDIFKASVFSGESNIGGGINYMLRDTKGTTIFGAEYNAPNWDFIETVIADGTRDRIILGRTHRFTPRFTMTLQSGLNQYNLQDFDEAARSFSLDGTASYAITSEHHYADFLGKDANLDLRYTLDAEYAFDVKNATSATGTYNPLPITSREVHGLVLVVGKHITNPLLLEVYGGYAIDRLGEDGIKYGTDLFFDITEKVELRAGYQHSVSTEVSSEELDSITAGLRAKF